MVNIERLVVNFYEVEAGWLRFKLKIGEQFFDGQFSSVFDPILDFKYWLEAIAIGVQQTSFRYNPEGNEVEFNFKTVDWTKEILIIQDNFEEGEFFIKASIKRKQLVRAFYLGLLTFANSNEFKSNEWEIEYLEERLCKGLNIDKDNLLDTLINLNREELIKLFFNADPSFILSFPTAKNKVEELKLFIKESIGESNGISISNRNEWNIPEHYDFWSTSEKVDYINECIKEPTNGFHGTKIDEFRSNLIEKYLEG